jgi:hypothetical protein
MIDEELYQQAADELNSDRRRPHIWARACALASDDHDEARYLYTNLRVEELLAERESMPPADQADAADQALFDKTLALEPAFEDNTIEMSDELSELSPEHDDRPGADSASSLPGVTAETAPGLSSADNRLNSEDSSVASASEELQLQSTAKLDAEPEAADSAQPSLELSAEEFLNQPVENEQPHQHEAHNRAFTAGSLSDSADDPSLDATSPASANESSAGPDNLRPANLDDTYAGLEDPTEVFQKELEKLRAEQGGVNIFESTAAFSRHLDGYNAENKGASNHENELDETAVDFDGTTEFNLDPAEIDRLASLDPTEAAAKLRRSSADAPSDALPDAAGTDDHQSSDSAITLEGQSDTAAFISSEASESEDKTVSDSVGELLGEADYQTSDGPTKDDQAVANVEEVLGDTSYEPPKESDPNDLEWLDEEPVESSTNSTRREPIIIGDQTLEVMVDGSSIDADVDTDDTLVLPVHSEAELMPTEGSDNEAKHLGVQDTIHTAQSELEANDQPFGIADAGIANENESDLRDALQETIDTDKPSDVALAEKWAELGAADSAPANDTGQSEQDPVTIPAAESSLLADSDSADSDLTDKGIALEGLANTERADDTEALSGDTPLTGDHPQPADEPAIDKASEFQPASQNSVEPASAPIAAAAAAVAHQVADDRSSTRDSQSAQAEQTSDSATPVPTTFPIDLTEDGQGKEFAIYRRHGKVKVVSTGVSWPALFLTLPFLLYRQLFGTAIVYVLTAIILIGGFVISVLAWQDAGADVEPLIQACTIGFGLLCFIGLVYLPFRFGNIWRGEKLENKGFELLAKVRARSPGTALTQVRNVAQIDLN